MFPVVDGQPIWVLEKRELKKKKKERKYMMFHEVLKKTDISLDVPNAA